MLAEGQSAYAINHACKAKGWGGLGYTDILRLQAEVAAKPSSLVTQVTLPPEVSPTLGMRMSGPFRHTFRGTSRLCWSG